MLEKEVIEPRRAERAEMERARTAARASAGLRYDYASELFSARRKDFWPLYQSRTVLEKLIPTLCHESDGLIFQVKPPLLVALNAGGLYKWCQLMASPHSQHGQLVAKLSPLLRASGLRGSV